MLKWKKITSEATYNVVRIFRASGELADYSLISTQDVADNSYYDPQGNRSSWYKIQYYDSVTGNASELSDPSQGGTYYGYCTVDEIRQMTNISASDISDTQLATMIGFAGAQINGDMNVHHEDEVIKYLDSHRSNKQDGVNSTFFTEHYPIGDANDDFRITVSDINVYSVDSSGTKTKLVVTQVNNMTGEFRLNTAPSGDVELQVTYKSTQRNVETPDTLIKMACIYLSAAMGYSKLTIGKSRRFKMGNLTVFRDTDSYNTYFRKYREIMDLINDRTHVVIHELEEWL